MSGYYPPGTTTYIDGPDEGVLHRCPNGHEWYATMFWELGGWFYDNDDDAFCPKCSEEGEPGG